MDNEYFHLLAYARFIKNFKFLAYSNEVGESIRHTFPKLVAPAYALSFGYVFADSFYHIYPTYKEKGWTKETIDKVKFYTTWHSIASMLLPTLVVGGSVKGTKFILQKLKTSVHYIRWIVPTVGIGMIPLVVEPIDHSVDEFVMKPIFKDKIFGDFVGDYYVPHSHESNNDLSNERN